MAYTWKTSFDQAYVRFSSGAILIEKKTERIFATTNVLGIDSCSVEGSFMAEIWPARRMMADVLIDVRPGYSPAF